MNEDYNFDISLKLLAGMPIKVEGFGYLEPLTIGEIIDYGYSKYSDALDFITLSKDTLMQSVLSDVSEEELQEISDLEVVIVLLSDEMKEQLEEAYKFFFKCENAFIDRDNLNVHLKYGEDDFKIVDRTNHSELMKIIKIQNYLDKIDDLKEEEKPQDEKVKKFKEKLKLLQRKRDEVKKKNSDEGEDEKLTFYDIMSSVSTKSNINELDIVKLTIYQFYSKFKRLDVISQYELDVQSLLAGSKDVKLKHWSKKI